MNPNHQLIVDLVRSHLPTAKLIYLFGSRANGYELPASDWDVAFVADSKTQPQFVWSLKETLANTLKQEVDLIDLLQANPVLQLQALDSGVKLYGTKHDDDEFAMIVYGMYGDWQSRRQPIIEDFVRNIKDSQV